ncbi:carbamoyltransferase HypF [Bacillus rubiinfantis]|uniref:carbamoyltransferase HypF n=1 Tax=Bacillus rubiinfantis TaxID=1499680 RepID=UPI0005A635E2|nr:carbamoyltransferase HypF [Bacillus rubiinfantis]
MLTAVNVAIRGRVQGVGFRPFVYQLACQLQLSGTVQNNMDGVKIFLEGEEDLIQMFLTEVKEKAPRLAKIKEILVESTAVQHVQKFSIIPSERSGTSQLVIPIDSAVCEDCLEEMNDPNDFRYQYPFINCTQCGPRYTIIDELPYDRPYTSMKSFPMCDDCQQEYEDPTNRRHHAQPIACPTCGPKVQLLDGAGTIINSANPIQETINLLKAGKIVAIKGIGGYHLCCDAMNEAAVTALRKKKNRPVRPLAVMAASLTATSSFAIVSDKEAELLTSPEAPIVILKKHHNEQLAASVAPNMSTIGVMLPYAPLHHLLLTDSELSVLVMTSANPSGLPLVYQDNDAMNYLVGIADFYLSHNREILHPVDDSVVQVNAGKLDFLRRSRGYVPDPFPTNQDVTGIVAFGGQQKTTFTIGRNKQIFIGPHIGDLENIETINHYHKELTHLLRWIDTPKTSAVIDAHPGYQAQNLLTDYDFAEVIKVQHHHAHMAGCIAEHQIDGKTFGIILDGTGYGLDGHIWGFEILYGDAADFKRIAHLHYTPLPGSEKSIREPWRNAAAMLISYHGDEGADMASLVFPDKAQEIQVLTSMIEKRINTVYAGTCGRLFDAVSAICGVTKVANYDGQAAIELAELTDETQIYEPYSFDLLDNELITIDFSTMLKEIVSDVLARVSVTMISSRFHETVVQAIMSAMGMGLNKNSNLEKTVVLSGGSLHNRYLRKRLTEELKEKGFVVFAPESIPCNDGGLSYGQLAVAAAKRRK